MLTADELRRLRRARLDGANKLAMAMELAETTQNRVAEGTGHTQPYISSLVNGKYSALPIETARKFAEFFGCSIEDLFPARDRSEVA